MVFAGNSGQLEKGVTVVRTRNLAEKLDRGSSGIATQDAPLTLL